MALIVFLRGINVGGHRRLRPTILARQLADYDIVSLGTAGTFVVQNPGATADLRKAFLDNLPFNAEIILCREREILNLVAANPFEDPPPTPDLVRFVSILSRSARRRPSAPIDIPTTGDWFVRILGSQGRLVFGVYRRHMKTIGHLSRLDDLYGVPATTRSWSTIAAVAKVLRGESQSDPPRRARV